MNNLEKLITVGPNIQSQYVESIVKKLAINKGLKEKDGTKFFQMYWQPFVMAAILGLTQNLDRIPINGKKENLFKYSVIQNNSRDILKTIICMVVAKEGYEVLLDPSNINIAIEEYANAGFKYLAALMLDDLKFHSEQDFYLLIDELTNN